MGEGAFEDGSVIGFKDGQAGVEQLAFRDDDHVEPRGQLITTKNLSNQALCSIPLDRTPQFPGGGDPQPAFLPFVGQEEQGAIPTVNPRTALIHQLELCASANMFTRAKSHR